MNIESGTHCATGGEQVEDVVVELGHMVAYVQLGVLVPGARILLSDVHSQHRTHDPHQKPGIDGNKSTLQYEPFES